MTMTKLYTLVLALVIGCSAQSLTTVTDTITDGSGVGVTGSCKYFPPTGRFTDASQKQVVGEPVTVSFTNGAFTARIVPTDTAVPSGQSYSVTCTGAKGWYKTGSWTVPTTNSTLKLKDIWTPTPPTPGAVIYPPQINVAGLSPGTYCLVVGTAGATGWAACSGSSGGSTGTFSWTALTSSGWSNMTSTNWSGLVQ